MDVDNIDLDVKNKAMNLRNMDMSLKEMGMHLMDLNIGKMNRDLKDMDTDVKTPTPKLLIENCPDTLNTREPWDTAPQGLRPLRLPMHKTLKIILLVGQSRLHKTLVLRHLTGRKVSAQDIKVDDPLEKHAHATAINGTPYLILDTPALIFQSLPQLSSSLGRLAPFATLAGALFVYDANLPVDPRDRLALRWLQCFVGPDMLSRVVVVAGMWDFYAHNIFWAPKRGLSADEDFTAVLSGGAELCLYQYGLRGGKAEGGVEGGVVEGLRGGIVGEGLESMVGRVFGAAGPIGRMQFVQETMEEGMACGETQAGRVLGADLDATMVVIANGRARVVELVAASVLDSGPVLESHSISSPRPASSESMPPPRSVYKSAPPTPPSTPAAKPTRHDRSRYSPESHQAMSKSPEFYKSPGYHRLSPTPKSYKSPESRQAMPHKSPKYLSPPKGTLKSTSRSSSSDTLVDQGRELVIPRDEWRLEARHGGPPGSHPQTLPSPKPILRSHPREQSPPPLPPRPLPPRSPPLHNKPLIPTHDGSLASILRFPFVALLAIVSFELGLAVSVGRLVLWLVMLYLRPVLWIVRTMVRLVLTA